MFALQLRESEELLVTMWDAVFAPPINLPGFNFSSGVAARNKLLPIVQVSLNMSLQLPLLQIIAACTV